MAGGVGSDIRQARFGGAKIGGGEGHALLGESVEIRRLEEFATHEAHVLPSQVVGQNEDEVGLLAMT